MHPTIPGNLPKETVKDSFFNSVMVIVAIIPAIIVLYYWLARGYIDHAAFYLAISPGMHSDNLHSRQPNKAE